MFDNSSNILLNSSSHAVPLVEELMWGKGFFEREERHVPKCFSTPRLLESDCIRPPPGFSHPSPVMTAGNDEPIKYYSLWNSPTLFNLEEIKLSQQSFEDNNLSFNPDSPPPFTLDKNEAHYQSNPGGLVSNHTPGRRAACFEPPFAKYEEQENRRTVESGSIGQPLEAEVKSCYQPPQTPKDKYAGLMTEAEKIYVRQLGVANFLPLCKGDFDYYYQVKSGNRFRHSGPQNRDAHSNHGSSSTSRGSSGAGIPHHELEFLRKNKDVLGVRSYFGASALKPRKSVEASISADFQQRWKTEHDFRTEIEMYNSLLDSYEKHHLDMTGPRNYSNPQFVHLRLCQAQALDNLWEMTKSGTAFVRVLSNPTGKILLCRMLRRLESERSYVLLGMIIGYFRNFMLPQFPEAEMAAHYTFFRQVIMSASVYDLLRMKICNIKRHELKCMASSQLGLTILLAILHQIEKIMVHSGGQSARIVINEWRDSALNIILAILVQHRGQGVASPFEVFENVLHHAGRYLNNHYDTSKLLQLFRKWTFSGIPLVSGNDWNENG